jgi:hypothetical protein
VAGQVLGASNLGVASHQSASVGHRRLPFEDGPTVDGLPGRGLLEKLSAREMEQKWWKKSTGHRGRKKRSPKARDADEKGCRSAEFVF